MSPRVLVYGFGNPGRMDDGLGPALAAELGARGLPGVSIESAYQLQVEDAALIATYDAVVFADADKACEPPFELRPLAPCASVAFSTHSLAPEAVLALAREVFGSDVSGYLLGIRGIEFDEFGEVLSEGARSHLAAAADHLEGVLRDEQLLEGPLPSEIHGEEQ